MLTYKQAEKFYDSFGKKQDQQFYEASAINVLLEHGGFADSKYIIEFGCGTGKLASRILKNSASAECRYMGVDLSQTMIDICNDNISPFSDRASCCKNTGKPTIDVADNSADRFVSAYVLDLLDESDISLLLGEAHRVLLPGGYLCLAGLTHGVSFISRTVEIVWNSLYRLKPSIVGGCRPIDLTAYLASEQWRIVHHATVVSYGVPSGVVIAESI